MATHRKPGTGKDRAYRAPAVNITLEQDAEIALSVWHHIVAQREAERDGTEPPKGLHRNRVDAIIHDQHGTAQAEMLHIAVQAAESDPLPTRPDGTPDIGARRVAEWDMVVALSETHRRFNLAADLVYDTSNTCSHGVAYSDDCPDCED